MTLPEPIRLLAAILDHTGPPPDEWRDQARAIVREASEPRTMADRITRGENIIGRRVVLPWCIGNPLGTVIHSVADKFGMSCVVQLDDGSVASSKATDTHDEGAERIGPLGHYRDEIGEPEKPAYVARWVLDSAPETWKLVTDKRVVATLRRRDIGDRGYGVTVKHPSAVWNTKHERADFGEYEARQLGWLPPGPVDRSQLDDYE